MIPLNFAYFSQHDRNPVDEMMKAFHLFIDDDSEKIHLRHLVRVARELGENMS